MAMLKRIHVLGLLVVLMSCTLASSAQRYNGRWEFLGQSHVDGKNDHDKIHVDRNETFRAIQLGIKGGTIEFYRVVVHFDSGQDHDVQVKQRIRANEKTRPIDLPGDRRRIRSVEVWYGKEGWRSRPTLNLWGLR